MHFKYIIEGGGRDDKCNMKIIHCMHDIWLRLEPRSFEF